MSSTILFSLSEERIKGLAWDGKPEPVSRDQIPTREQRGHGKRHFPCSADHEQDWYPCPVLIQTLLKVLAIQQHTVPPLDFL